MRMFTVCFCLMLWGCEQPKLTLDDESSVFNESTGTTMSGSANTNNNNSNSNSGGSTDAAPRPSRDGGAHRPDAGTPESDGSVGDDGSVGTDGGATARCQTVQDRNIAFIGHNPSLAPLGNAGYVVAYTTDSSQAPSGLVYIVDDVRRVAAGPYLPPELSNPKVSAAGTSKYLVAGKLPANEEHPYDWQVSIFNAADAAEVAQPLRTYFDSGPLPLLASTPDRLLIADINLATNVPACEKKVSINTFSPDTMSAPFQLHGTGCLPNDFEGRRASMVRFAANGSKSGFVQLMPGDESGEQLTLLMLDYEGRGTALRFALGQDLQVIAMAAMDNGFAILWRDSQTPAGSANFSRIDNDGTPYVIRRIPVVGTDLVWNGRHFLLADQPRQDGNWLHLLSEYGEHLSDVEMWNLRPIADGENRHVSIAPRGNYGFTVARDGLYEDENGGDIPGISVHALNCD